MALLSSSSAPPAAPSSELPTPRQAEETKEEEEEDDNIDIDQLEPLESLDITVDRALLERGTSSGGSPERKRKNPPSPGPGGVDGSPVVSESSAMVRNVSDFLADQQLQPEQSETENLPPEQQQSAGPGTSLSTSNAIRTPKPPSGKSLPEDSPLRSSSRKRKFQDEYDPDDDDLMTPRIGSGPPCPFHTLSLSHTHTHFPHSDFASLFLSLHRHRRYTPAETSSLQTHRPPAQASEPSLTLGRRLRVLWSSSGKRVGRTVRSVSSLGAMLVYIGSQQSAVVICSGNLVSSDG